MRFILLPPMWHEAERHDRFVVFDVKLRRIARRNLTEMEASQAVRRFNENPDLAMPPIGEAKKASIADYDPFENR